jgi:ABC-type bacteriocin/lantibiotic exporter with double-glycine peptidase domain
MKFVFDSLHFLLSRPDIKKVYLMSLLLLLVSIIEVVGLGLISFLILNLGNVDSALLQYSFVYNASQSLGITKSELSNYFYALVLIYSLVTVIISILAIRYQSITSHLIGSRVKLKLIDHFLTLDWESILQSPPSETAARVLNDGDQVARIIIFSMHLISRCILSAIIMLALFFYNPYVTLILIGSIGPIYLIIFFGLKPTVVKNATMASSFVDYSMKIIRNMFGSIKEIIFYNNQKNVLLDFQETNIGLAKSEGINTALAYIPRSIIDSMLLMLLVGSAVIANSSGVDNTDYFLTLSVYGIAAMKLLPAFQNIFYFSHEINARYPYLQNIISLLEVNPLDKEEENKGTKFLFNKDITLDNISFKYKNANKASIESVNIKIVPGDRIAIIGPSGSGKSTFLDILLGFLEINSDSSISVDGHKLKKSDFSSYRQLFSLVPQKIYLLEGTLEENIVFGASSSKEINPRLMEAISLSGLGSLVGKLPNGLSTKLSDDKQIVSGGQKQSIGLARAFFRQRKILVLDEATSAMDFDLEAQILKNISSSEFETIIGITHKASILKYFNKICIFRNGRIEDFGSFDELLLKNTFLSEMMQKNSDIN